MPARTLFGLHLSTRVATLLSGGDPGITHSLTHGLLLPMAEIADREPMLGSVWIGDNILVAPRLSSIPFMASVAAKTSRVLIGGACMSSFALRHPIALALDWATLDLLSSGRMILVPCLGHAAQGPLGEKQRAEWAAFQRDLKDRIGLFEEGIEVVRGLWGGDRFSYGGRHYQLKEVALPVKPVQRPPPIWIANHPVHISDPKVAERSARRIARLADGWQVADSTPEEFVRWRDWIVKLGREEFGRRMDGFETCFLARVNINADREVAFNEGISFGTEYMRYQYSKERADRYLFAYGSADDCIRSLERIVEHRPTHVDVQLSSRDQMGQLRRLVREVLPSF